MDGYTGGTYNHVMDGYCKFVSYTTIDAMMSSVPNQRFVTYMAKRIHILLVVRLFPYHTAETLES
jgi:hypothetical protein